MKREEIFSHPAFLKMLDLFLDSETEPKKGSPVPIHNIALRKDLDRRVEQIQAKRKEKAQHATTEDQNNHVR